MEEVGLFLTKYLTVPIVILFFVFYLAHRIRGN